MYPFTVKLLNDAFSNTKYSLDEQIAISNMILPWIDTSQILSVIRKNQSASYDVYNSDFQLIGSFHLEVSKNNIKINISDSNPVRYILYKQFSNFIITYDIYFYYMEQISINITIYHITDIIESYFISLNEYTYSKLSRMTDKEISKITGFPVRNFIAKIRRKETWTYLTKDIDTPLGKAERKTFTYK